MKLARCLTEKEQINYFDLIAACGGENLHPGGKEASRTLFDMCGISKNQTVLEIGCGSGFTSCYLAQEFSCKVTGMDLNPIMIEKAKERSQKLLSLNRPHFLVGDAHELPFPEQNFDRILCEGCTSFMPNKWQVAAEYYRVLKRGSLLGELEFYYHTLPPKALLTKLNRALPSYYLENWSDKDWFDLYEGAGFKLLDTKSFGYSAFTTETVRSSTQRLVEYFLQNPHPALPHDPSLLTDYFLYYQELFNENRKYLAYRLYAFIKP